MKFFDHAPFVSGRTLACAALAVFLGQGLFPLFARASAAQATMAFTQTRLDLGNWVNTNHGDIGLFDPGRPFWLDLRLQNLGETATSGRAEVNVWVIGVDSVQDTLRGAFDEVLVFPPGSLKRSRSGTAWVTTSHVNVQATRSGWVRFATMDLGIRLLPPDNGPLEVWVSVVYRDDEGRITSELNAEFSDVQGNRVRRLRILANTLPEIESPPGDAEVTEGTRHLFVVSARHQPPMISRSGFWVEQTHLRYQWESSGDGGLVWLSIPGATSSSFVIDRASLALDRRQYRVVVSNRAGAVVSEPATLRVFRPGLWGRARATDTNPPFLYLDWFGFFREGEGGWIFHSDHGWQYYHGTDTDSLFFYDLSLDLWGWTSEAAYPWIHWFAPVMAWTYFQAPAVPGERWFFHAGEGRWLHESQILAPASP